jgi:hypothetical protein
MTLQQNGCFSSRTIQHELLHILGMIASLNLIKILDEIIIGFYHEQSRPDRDNFLTINYANIPEANVSQYLNSIRLFTRESLNYFFVEIYNVFSYVQRNTILTSMLGDRQYLIKDLLTITQASCITKRTLSA